MKDYRTHVQSFNLYINQKTTMEIVMTATVSTIDVISNIGGTLGLFLGFSLLSGVELIYWACSCLGLKRSKKNLSIHSATSVTSVSSVAETDIRRRVMKSKEWP